MQEKAYGNSFANACFFAATLSALLITVILLVYFLLPTNNNNNNSIKVVEKPTPVTIVDLSEDTEEEFSAAFQDYFAEVSLNKLTDNSDDGLTLYRQNLSRSAVEWFYYQITGNRNIAQAIITEAEKNDISLSLAFALAHTESNYNEHATNRNANASIDRGLFQLNSNSFPALTEADFFDPYVSARYGLSHLKFCLNTAGNEVSALAMYNAGTTRVRSNKTPQTTLNYVGKIMDYQKMLDKLFDEQVSAYFENQLDTGLAVALAK